MPNSFSPFTLGVEEEFQLVDARTGELRSRADAVLSADWTGEIKPEMQKNTVEIGTRVCRSGGELREELARLRLQAAVAAESDGLRVVAAGTHPFTHYAGQEYTAGATYRRLEAEYRQLAHSQNIFGMHVHVGVPEGVDRVRLGNVVRQFLPHLLALSASSPYFLGEDTGYASYRSILWRRWPRSGPPPRMEDQAEFARLVDALGRTGCIDAPGRIYWELRAHHQYPTLEFRVADVTPRVDDAVCIAVLTRALVVATVRGMVAEPPMSEPILRTLLVENGWRASRDGLRAELIDLEQAALPVLPAAEAVFRLAERLAPLAEELGDEEALQCLPELLERGDAAARIRERRAEGEWAEVVRWLADETVLGLGMDRRTEQRDDRE